MRVEAVAIAMTPISVSGVHGPDRPLSDILNGSGRLIANLHVRFTTAASRTIGS
jgi:hypothetical protein